MADVVSAVVRSRMMAGIRSINTKPEMIVRGGLHRAGFRFRLHDRRLPGKPDVVFAKYAAVLFVHGCFWHGHDCHLFKWPATRTDFWRAKIDRNRERDAASVAELHDLGWRVGIVWECAIKGRTRMPLEGVISICANWLRSGLPGLEVRGA